MGLVLTTLVHLPSINSRRRDLIKIIIKPLLTFIRQLLLMERCPEVLLLFPDLFPLKRKTRRQQDGFGRLGSQDQCGPALAEQGPRHQRGGLELDAQRNLRCAVGSRRQHQIGSWLSSTSTLLRINDLEDS